MGQAIAYFYPDDDENAALTFSRRIRNALRYQYRGILSALLSIIIILFFVLYPDGSLDGKKRAVLSLWLIMFVFFGLVPMGVPVTGTMPIFVMPLTAALSSVRVAGCYFGESLALMLVGGMMSMLLCNTGYDKRISLYILSSGPTKTFSGRWLVFKAGLAAYLSGAFSHTLISSANLYEILSSATESLAIRDYVNMAVQTSSTLGSLAPLHGALTIIAARAMYYEYNPENTDFNYFHYAWYSVPCSIVMFCANIIYYILLVTRSGKLTEAEMESLKTNLQTKAADQPPRNIHQYLAIFFITLYFVVCFLRSIEPKWFSVKTSDATIAVVFVFALHTLPRELQCFKIFTAETKSVLPELRPLSAILWWKYVDKNSPYAYMLLIGGGVALVRVCKEIALDVASVIPKAAVFILAPILSCFISPTAVCVILLPMMAKIELADALIVGIGSSLAFTMPFHYTPAYFCHHAGNTPEGRMISIGIGSKAVCGLILVVFGIIIDLALPKGAP